MNEFKTLFQKSLLEIIKAFSKIVSPLKECPPLKIVQLLAGPLDDVTAAVQVKRIEMQSAICELVFYLKIKFIDVKKPWNLPNMLESEKFSSKIVLDEEQI